MPCPPRSLCRGIPPPLLVRLEKKLCISCCFVTFSFSFLYLLCQFRMKISLKERHHLLQNQVSVGGGVGGQFLAQKMRLLRHMYFTSYALPHMAATPARPADLCCEAEPEPPGHEGKQPPLGATSGLKSRKAAASSLKCKVAKQKFEVDRYCRLSPYWEIMQVFRYILSLVIWSHGFWATEVSLWGVLS